MASTPLVLLSIPDDVLHLMAHLFLTDRETFAFARTNTTLLHSMKRYDIDEKSASISEMISNHRWEIEKLIEALKAEKLRAMRKTNKHAKLPTQYQSQVKGKYQIGRITHLRIIPDEKRPTLHKHLHLLPSCLKTVLINDKTLAPLLSELRLPDSVTRLRIESPFRGSIESLQLPASLTELTFSPDKTIAVCPIEKLNLPPTLTKLSLLDSFNSPIEGLVLPSSLREFTIAHDFNQPVERLVLNEGLTSLTFDSGMFDQPFEALRLPSTLTHLSIGHAYEQGYSFQQRLRDWNPPASLTSFELGAHDIGGDTYANLVFPKNLTAFDYPPSGALFVHTQLPSVQLTRLTLPSFTAIKLSEIRFPDCLTQLRFGDWWNQAVVHWNPPASLRSIVLGSKWNLRPESRLSLPLTLTHIEFGTDFAQRLDLVRWPPVLECLTIKSQASELSVQELPQNLPGTMRRIEISSRSSSLWYMVTLPTEECRFYEIGTDEKIRLLTEQQRDAHRATYLTFIK